MRLGKITSGGVVGVFLRWASRLRFPYLFFLTLVLFVLNLFIPDMVPFADELIMGLAAALLGSLKNKSNDSDYQPPPDTQA